MGCGGLDGFLNAYLTQLATGALKKETVERMIHAIFTGPKAKLIPLNLAALQRGMDCVQ